MGAVCRFHIATIVRPGTKIVFAQRREIQLVSDNLIIVDLFAVERENDNRYILVNVIPEDARWVCHIFHN